MSMESWAKREVEIACSKSAKDSKGDCFDGYYEACCKSALKALECLSEDGHSGMSISITKSILNRLIDGKPLTEIEDTDDVWNEVSYMCEDRAYRTFQCKRMSSLFKDVYTDGTVKYSDVDRVVCHHLDNPNVCYHSGLADRVIQDIYPITMPYYPGKSFSVVCEDFLVYPENGDYDTVGILTAITPEGEEIEINKFFHEMDGKMIEISEAVYYDYKNLAVDK